MLKLKEIIVVEGKDDARAVKQAVDAEVIITSGFQISRETFNKIRLAQKKKGVIIFTDPDYPGEQIRQRINNQIKGCKNAYLTQKEALKNNDIGIENATPQNILRALKQAKCKTETKTPVFTQKDLFDNHLSSGRNATKRREFLGKLLGIGYANGKQLKNRLNTYDITRDQFDEAIKQVNILLEGPNF